MVVLKTFSSLISIDERAEALAVVKDLYLSSFPAEERRAWVEWQKLLLEVKVFELYLAFVEGEAQAVAFLTLWQLDEGLSYIEHFAVSPLLRSQGLGKACLRMLLQELSTAVVLECEEPNTLDAQRRIAFYQSLGFEIWTKSYAQPPYHLKLARNNKAKYEASFLPMYLLRYSNGQNPSLEQSIHSLYEKVYACNKV